MKKHEIREFRIEMNTRAIARAMDTFIEKVAVAGAWTAAAGMIILIINNI